MGIKVYASVKDIKSNTGNSGDAFGYYLTSKLLKNHSCAVFEKLGTEDRQRIDANTFVFVGSILAHIPKYKMAKIYGPGFICKEDNSSNLIGNQICGVRGFLSQEKFKTLNHLPPVVSDPGLLLSEFFKPVDDIGYAKRMQIGFVIHSVDRKQFFDLHPNFKSNLIDNYGDFETYVNKLIQCDLIVTSSLHGAVFCHSLGIKVAVVQISGKVIGNDYKYLDYYSSLGMDFRFMKIDDLVHLDDFIERAAMYPQPSQVILKYIKSMQLHDIRNLLKGAYP